MRDCTVGQVRTRFFAKLYWYRRATTGVDPSAQGWGRGCTRTGSTTDKMEGHEAETSLSRHRPIAEAAGTWRRTSVSGGTNRHET